MKKILAFTLIFVLAFGSVSFAAVGSSRTKSSTSRPSTSTSIPSSNTTKQAAPDTGYKPSAPANSYSDKAPSSQVKPGTPNSQQQTTGGFWRNAGMFGGGMLMGSMLSSMFGFGSMGAMSSIFGVIFNILILAGIIMGIRFLWNKFRANNNRRDM